MTIEELTWGLGLATVPETGAAVSGVEHDSRKVGLGTLFVAIRGTAVDGNLFVGEAVRRGAVAVVTDRPDVTSQVPVIHVRDARRALAVISDRFFGSPQESLIMTAITGTNGKTTTAHMVCAMFEAQGIGCGMLGTIRHLVGGREIVAKNTTPESRDIHEYLAAMVVARQHACVMEVSSHALSLSRVHGIRYRAVAFLNITRDHLDFHGDFSAYLDAKSLLFSELSGDATAVVNRDDPYADHIISLSRGGRVITFGFSEGCDIRPTAYTLGPSGSDVTLLTPDGTCTFRLPVPGRFNISNAMAAAGIAIACNLPLAAVTAGLERMPLVRGRFEIIDEGQDFTVIVDYAHTPDALERILTAAREITTGRLISVFGCGGDRDRGKRPQMGGISSRLANITIVTSDNPRTEDPAAIIAEILEGVEPSAIVETWPDRLDAITAALAVARTGDAVVIAGKGHENYQIIGAERRHFDDAETARRILKAREWNTSQSNGS